MLRKQDRHSAEFDMKVQSWIISQLHDQALNFQKLLERLPGVYPTVAVRAVRQLSASGQLSHSIAERLIKESSSEASGRLALRSFLPLPHPLDFEWRFTPDSSRYLLDLAENSAGTGKTILLFGTPGVALEALSGCSDQDMIFMGEDNAVTQRIRSFSQAVGGNLRTHVCGGIAPHEVAEVVIVDPPWYLDFIRPMLAAAATACRKSGLVFVSLPPVGANKSAEETRKKTESFALRHGLQSIEHLEGAVSYETPFFEANALRAAGFSFTDAWRRGDLVIFRKIFEHSRETTTASLRKIRWTGRRVGRMRIYVRGDRPCTGVRGLRSIIKGDILPTVSRRDRRRTNASVWTSGNRIFYTDNPTLLLKAADSLSGENDCAGGQADLQHSAAEQKAIERVADILSGLAEQEAAEERAMRHVAVGEWRGSWISTLENYRSAPKMEAFG